MSINAWLFDNNHLNLAAILPDHYQGGKEFDKQLLVARENNDDYLLMSGRQLKYSCWHNVYIVAQDQLMITALRYLLAPICPVRLRIYHELNALNEALLSSTALVPDLVIWVTTRGGYQSGLVSTIVRLKRQTPHLRQLVIHDGFPDGMENIAEALSGLKLINANAQIANIIRELENQLLSIKSKTPAPLFNGPRLTKRQWEVLLLQAQHKSIKEIARQLNIDIHTVSSHRSTALQRFNIIRHEQRIWLYQILHEAISGAPGLKRSINCR